MRICRVMPSYPTDTEPGIGLAAYELLAHMQEPTLVITKRRRGTPAPPPDHVRLVRLPYWEVTLGGRRGMARSVRLALKFVGYLVFWLLSIPYMIAFRPRITHIHTPMPILHGLFGKYALRSRLYLSFHGSDIDAVGRSPALRWLIRRADVLCIVSAAMRPPLEEFAPNREILYTPNGVDTDTFSSDAAARKPVVCMVGSLRWQKDYPTALSAFARFRTHAGEWSLVIVGEGPDRHDLEQMTTRLGVQGSVEFRGSQSREQVATLMRSSRIFMLSSVSEGFPKVVLEAASSGTPLVVTDVGSCREVAERAAGMVVPPQEPVALSEALARLATDDDAWRHASEQGPKAAQHYSWSTTAEILLASYAS